MNNVSRFRPGLEKALALVDTHGIEDLVQRIDEDKAQLWIRDEALIVTEIIQYPKKKVLQFWAATGKLEDVIALSRSLLKWGKTQGCELALLTGRRGWVKPLRTEGWTERMAVLTQEL